MSDAVWLGVLGMVPLTLTALGGLVLAVKTYAEAKTIAGHVNSEKTELLGKIAAKDLIIALHVEHIQDLKLAAGLLAQASAQRTRDIAGAVTAAAAPLAGAEPVKVDVVNDPLITASTLVLTDDPKK